jgi:hypothetical protein
MIDAFDEALFFELVDDAGHRTEPHIQVRGQLAHRRRALEVETPQDVGLRHAQPAVQRIVGAAELIQLGQLVQTFIEPMQIGAIVHAR